MSRTRPKQILGEYEVKVYETYIVTYRVAAHSVEDAMARVLDREGERVDDISPKRVGVNKDMGQDGTFSVTDTCGDRLTGRELPACARDDSDAERWKRFSDTATDEDNE